MNNQMQTPIPAFEGRPVEAITVKVAGSAPLEDLGDTVLSVDDRVQLLSVYTVVAVRHEVDQKTGNLTRTQVLKPVEMHLMPFDEDDPSDDGIIRAIMPGSAHVSGGNGSGQYVGGDDDDE